MRTKRCARNGCAELAVYQVRFKEYNDRIPTLACSVHGTWWARGMYGQKIADLTYVSDRGLQ